MECQGHTLFGQLLVESDSCLFESVKELIHASILLVIKPRAWLAIKVPTDSKKVLVWSPSMLSSSFLKISTTRLFQSEDNFVLTSVALSCCAFENLERGTEYLELGRSTNSKFSKCCQSSIKLRVREAWLQIQRFSLINILAIMIFCFHSSPNSIQL